MPIDDSTRRAKALVENYSGRKIKIMEVCGTHTHEIFRLGIRNVLPDSIELISGPGCPVCVTPVGYIDEAIMLGKEKGVHIFTFGDLIRVPGTEESLADLRGAGCKVDIVYSPLDALGYAEENPNEDVCFLSVGFETTTPGSAISVRNARRAGITNYSILTANKTMYNAYRALKGSADAFLYPGHVSTMTGMNIYRELREEGISGVVAGFTAAEILTALVTIIRCIEQGRSFAENCYPRVVSDEGSPAAQKLVNMIMEPCDAEWRGLGKIDESGMKLKKTYYDYDARLKYGIPDITGKSNPACRCGEVLLGKIKPYDCGIFGKICTPEHPVGACMVSGEGACSAFYKYGGKLCQKI